MGTHIAIITPIFLGSGTGAATYYRLLTQTLAQKGCKFTIISENTDEDIPDFVSEYYGMWPTRTGKNKQKILDIAIYGIQNLAYLRLFKVLEESKPDSILVHSSFYNFPGIFAPIINLLIRRRPRPQKWVVDVRDVLLPTSQVHQLTKFDRIVACSLNVKQRLLNNAVPDRKVIHIPIPQEPLKVDSVDAFAFLSRLNLIGKRYLLYVGMVKEAKAVDLLLEAFSDFVRPFEPDLILVVAGFLKTHNLHIKELLNSPGVLYIGNQRREDIHSLIARAQLCINLSPNEGLPRSSLEALALRRPTLLPPNVPEFSQECPEFVVNSRQPDEVGQRIRQALQEKKVAYFSVEKHFPERVLSQYEEILL